MKTSTLLFTLLSTFLSTLPFLLAALLSTAVITGCGSDKPSGWWQQDDACPTGSAVVKTASEIYCATEDGTRHGRYNRLDGKSSVVVSGSYKSGVEDGLWKRHGADGDVLDSFEVRDGAGLVKVWRDDGSLESQHELTDGVKNGAFFAWSTDARFKLEEGRFEKAQRVGTWLYRNDQNELIREVDYRKGEVWTTRHFENGAIARTELSEKAKADAQAKAKAQRAGILGMLAQEQGAFASLEGLGSGLKDADVYGGLLGNEVGEMKGGLGLSGVGSGGGGTGWGTIGTAKHGQIGKGSGTAEGYGRGSGRIANGGGGYSSGGGAVKRRAIIAKFRLGRADVRGDLDKNIVRRYIRRRRNQLRHCYERELVKKPALAGTVVASFSIGSKGTVTQSTAKGLGNKAVEKCIERAIRGIKFPTPKSGGTVKVSYPLVFSKRSA